MYNCLCMLNGIILVDKPAGFTSFDIIKKIRYFSKQKRVGHTGTLDPSVTGLLIIALGKATKLINCLQLNQKQYIGKMILGIDTNTQDMDGEITNKKRLDKPFSDNKLKKNFESFIGPYLQTPPMFSAVKVHGQRLYDLARQGKKVKRKSRKIIIQKFYQIGSSKFDKKNGKQYINFFASVSKGSYIRTLVNDFGKRLLVPSVLKKLRRIKVGKYSVNQAYNFKKILSYKQINKLTIPLENILTDVPKINIKASLWKKVKNGGFFNSTLSRSYLIRIFYKNKFQALYKYDSGKKIYKPKVMLIHEIN